MKDEQTEYFLHLLSALVEAHGKQAASLERIAQSLEDIDDRIYNLPYRLKQEGIL